MLEYVAAKQTAFKATEPEIELSKEEFVYNKQEKTPDVIKGLEAFTEGVDYTVTYENNTKAGIGQVIIEGKGDLQKFSARRNTETAFVESTADT